MPKAYLRALHVLLPNVNSCAVRIYSPGLQALEVEVWWILMRCHYEVLELELSADEAAIKKAYRRAALLWHPGMLFMCLLM